MIDPFANNSQSMQVGDLIIENQKDKIIIYGDIDLHLNAQGYKQAQQLHELTAKILQAFVDSKKDSNNEALSKENNDREDKTIDNPFL